MTTEIKFHSHQKCQLQKTIQETFFFDENRHFDLHLINDLKILNVFSVIKICKRSLNGTSIHTRNCLIRTGCTIHCCWRKHKIIQFTKKPDFKFVSIDVKPSAGFKRKANPTEGGKWKIVSCHWNMDSNEEAVINSPSSVMGEGFSTLVQEELVIIIMYVGNFQNKMKIIFMKV